MFSLQQFHSFFFFFCNIIIIRRLCNVCAKGLNPSTIVCELCSNTGGAYKPTTSKTWVHCLCAMWVPEVLCHDHEKMEPYICTGVDPARFKLKCSLCSTKGACIQCSYGRCSRAAHPSCALDPSKGFTHRIFKDFQGDSVWEVFCKQHADQVKEPYKPPKTKIGKPESNNKATSKAYLKNKSDDDNFSDDEDALSNDAEFYDSDEDMYDSDNSMSRKKKRGKKKKKNYDRIKKGSSWKSSSYPPEDVINSYHAIDGLQESASFEDGSTFWSREYAQRQLQLQLQPIDDDDDDEEEGEDEGDSKCRKEKKVFPICTFSEWPGQGISFHYVFAYFFV